MYKERTLHVTIYKRVSGGTMSNEVNTKEMQESKMDKSGKTRNVAKKVLVKLGVSSKRWTDRKPK